MKSLPYYYIGVATLFVIVGMCVGIYMGISQDFTFAPAHAHLNLLGWVSMAIYGLYFRAVPSAINRLATVHFWLVLVANIIFPIGIAMSVVGQGAAVAGIGGVLEILAMLLFAYIVWTHRAGLTT